MCVPRIEEGAGKESISNRIASRGSGLDQPSVSDPATGHSEVGSAEGQPGSSRPSSSSSTDGTKTREWVTYNHIAKYAKPDDAVATWLTVETMLVYWGLFAGACLYEGPFKWQITTLLTILCGMTRTRVFCLMHDMAHHSFFSSRTANEVGAVLLGVMVYTPYSGWSKGHNYHHRHSNNTDRKQTAQTAPLTVSQFRSMAAWQRTLYNMVYGHYTLLTTTPWLYFVIGQRFISRWYENCLVFAYWGLIYQYGTARVVSVDVATAAIGASLGVFLFHIQHTFEGSYKASGEEYSRFENGMHGSSFLVVPEALKYFTSAIEYHNVHHLNTRVPLYRLRQCFEDGGDIFQGVPTFTILDALKRLPYSLRHDETRTFVSCYEENLSS